ncbi:MAG: hypothetical protein ACFFC1_21570 [Promethearchaeota archaeon]
MMKKNEKTFSEIYFEDEESIINSLKVIKSEYFKKAIKAFFCILFILTIYLIYLILWFQPNIFLPNNTTLEITSTIRKISFNLTTGWAFFSISIFITAYLIKLIRMKFTPSLICFMKKEVHNIGLKFQKRFASSSLFLMLNSGAVALLIYIDFGIIQLDGSYISNVIQSLIILYLILSITIPVIWIFVNDKFVAKLKQNFFVLFEFHYKIRKKRGYDPNLVGIYLTSNRLCSRFNKSGKEAYSKISEIRWLPRKGKTNFELNPYLHFHEFSAPVNFQKQFLNITLALNEWDENYILNHYYRNASYSYLKNMKIRLFSNENYLFSWRIRV